MDAGSAARTSGQRDVERLRGELAFELRLGEPGAACDERCVDRLLGDAKDVLATSAKALGKGEDLLVAGAGGDAALDARHVSSPSKFER